MLSVTRADAIGFQLDMAIRLWFEGSDPISAHTLACNALHVAHDLGKVYGKKSMLIDSLPKEHHKAAAEAQNFFKHADKDPHKVLSFNPELTRYHIFDAVNLYSQLFRGYSPPMATFLLRCSIVDPSIRIEKIAEKFSSRLDKAALAKMNNQEFFANVMPVFMRQANVR
ncbi:MAG: hypothetical protein P4L99_04805 [Chthoniobacter sp.]|nr:hypothetical protein [Chthoniobacter sp.]